MSDKKSIWVVYAEGCDNDGTFTCQLLGKARGLHEEGEALVTAVHVGHCSQELLEKLSCSGAHEVLYDPVNIVSTQHFIDRVCNMAAACKPELILVPSTPIGRACAASLAITLHAGLTADCFEIVNDAKYGYIFSRTAAGSSVMAHIACIDSNVQICTVGKNVFPDLAIKFEQKGLLTKFSNNFSEEASDIKDNFTLLSKRPRNVSLMNQLDSAKLIFAFGRGLTGTENLDLLYKAAKKYGAGIAGTRSVVESCLIDKSRQVGQSGISVAPNVYVAFGISGASQHTVGFKNAKCVIAVNKDKTAPIFRYADYGIIGDCGEILKELGK